MRYGVFEFQFVLMILMSTFGGYERNEVLLVGYQKLQSLYLFNDELQYASYASILNFLCGTLMLH